jgi:hypothetical protein
MTWPCCSHTCSDSVLGMADMATAAKTPYSFSCLLAGFLPSCLAERRRNQQTTLEKHCQITAGADGGADNDRTIPHLLLSLFLLSPSQRDRMSERTKSLALELSGLAAAGKCLRQRRRWAARSHQMNAAPTLRNASLYGSLINSHGDTKINTPA